MNLLLRMYDPTFGRVLLDGLDLRDYAVADLRNQFAIVQRDTVVLSASVAKNIEYGRPDASLPDLPEPAVAANAHGFATERPEGYDTQLGQRGMRSSGGERQRLSLARAFLRDAPALEFCDVRLEIEGGAVEPGARGPAARPARVAPGGSGEEVVESRTAEGGA